MNVTILQFSPSGNTSKVSGLIKSILEKEGNFNIQLIDISGSMDFFGVKRNIRLIEDEIKKHDILLVGGPVYAHHLQYHVKDLIRKLPKPDNNKWGKIALPFVTYGGITSGCALEEAGKLLKRSGRTVIGGLKIVASHRVTRAFMDNEFNSGKPGEEIIPIINELKERLKSFNCEEKLKDKSAFLRYRSRLEVLKINLIFNEKLWHKLIYPKVAIDQNLCKACGKCIAGCPVRHLLRDNSGMVCENSQSDCIHCLNCVVTCSRKAVKFKGKIDKMKMFMSKMIKEKGNSELPGSCFYS